MESNNKQPNVPVRIAVCNQKGGVGKSTFTTLLASHLHYSLGRDVLVVDCDYPQWSIHAQRERELAAVEQSDNYKLMMVRQFRLTDELGDRIVFGNGKISTVNSDGYVISSLFGET